MQYYFYNDKRVAYTKQNKKSLNKILNLVIYAKNLN